MNYSGCGQLYLGLHFWISLCSSRSSRPFAAGAFPHQRLISLEASVKWFKFLIKMFTSAGQGSKFSVTDMALPSPKEFHSLYETLLHLQNVHLCFQVINNISEDYHLPESYCPLLMWARVYKIFLINFWSFLTMHVQSYYTQTPASQKNHPIYATQS